MRTVTASITSANLRPGTDPNSRDSDGDGINDGTEINTLGSDPLSTDGDGDLMPDAYEYANGLDPASAADKYLDLDGDGLANMGEFRFGTDPNDAASVAQRARAGTSNPLKARMCRPNG